LENVVELVASHITQKMTDMTVNNLKSSTEQIRSEQKQQDALLSCRRKLHYQSVIGLLMIHYLNRTDG
jgi:hypothetical protein